MHRATPSARQQFESELKMLERSHPGYTCLILEQPKAVEPMHSPFEELEELRNLRKCIVAKEVRASKVNTSVRP